MNRTIENINKNIKRNLPEYKKSIKISKAAKGFYRISYDDGSNEYKDLSPAKARKIRNQIKEETTADAITYLPGRLGVIKALLKDFEKDLDIEVLENTDHRVVNLGNSAKIIVPNETWVEFNDIFGGKLFAGKQKYNISPLLDESNMYLPALRHEVIFGIKEFFNSKLFENFEENVEKWLEIFENSEILNKNFPVNFGRKYEDIEDMIEHIMSFYGDDPGNLCLIVESLSSDTFLEKYVCDNCFSYGCVIETKIGDSKVLFETTMDGSAPQSIKCENPRTVIEMMKSFSNLKRIDNVFYPESGSMFDFNLYEKIKNLFEDKLPRIVKLTDFSDDEIEFLVTNSDSPHKNAKENYSKFLKKAIEIQKKRNLKYNTKTGMVSDSSGELSRPVGKENMSTYQVSDDIVTWEFGGEIWNTAGRLSRGFPD